MLRLIVASLCLTPAVAFAPVAHASARSSSLAAFDIKTQPGAQMPLGYFDPFGILVDADEETFNVWRKIELKHGRIAMAAVLGNTFFLFERFDFFFIE